MTELTMTTVGSDTKRCITAFDIVRVVLAAILLIAAALKAYQLATEPVANKDIFSYRWSLMIQVEFEIVFGLWLLSGAYQRLSWGLALACFTFFCCVTLYKALSGEASCGCFGKVSVNPWYTLILDGAAVVALLVFQPRVTMPQVVASNDVPQNHRRRFAMAIVLAAMVGIPTGITIGTYTPGAIAADGTLPGTGSIVLLEPEKWVGKPLPIRDYIAGVNLDDGDWVVLLVHHDCPHCQKTMADYAPWALAVGDNLRVAFIEIPPYGLPPEVPGSPTVFGKLKNDKEWFVTTPVVLLVRRGVLSKVWQADEVPVFEEIIWANRQLRNPIVREHTARLDS